MEHVELRYSVADDRLIVLVREGNKLYKIGEVVLDEIQEWREWKDETD